jgi:hypothetical protein
MFFSPSANANVSVNTFRGGLNCWAQAGSAGRMPDLKPGFVSTARSSTRSRRSTATSTSPTVLRADRHGRRAVEPPRDGNIQFSKADGKSAPILIIVDANTGKVEQVIRN